MINKIVNGVLMPLTPEEQAVLDAPKPLNEAKQEAKQQLTDIRLSNMSGVMDVTISSGTFPYPYSENLAMQHFNRFSAISAGLISLPSYWRDENDSNNVVVVNDFRLLALAMSQKLESHATRGHSDKDLIDAATDIDAIDSIVSDYKSFVE